MAGFGCQDALVRADRLVAILLMLQSKGQVTAAEVAEVVTHRFAALEGIKRTHTMVAFEVFSQHDLEALFSIGG